MQMYSFVGVPAVGGGFVGPLHSVLVNLALVILTSNSCRFTTSLRTDVSTKCPTTTALTSFVFPLTPCSYSQDEKALKFLTTVPPQWRVFWAIHSVGISFALALIAVVYIGDPSKILLNTDGSLFDVVPSWFIWVVNPGAVTLCSFVISVVVQGFSEACSEVSLNIDTLTWGAVGERVYLRLYAALKRAEEGLVYEPFFYASLALWLAVGVITWWFLVAEFWFPVAVEFPSSSDSEDCFGGLKATKNIVGLIFSIMALVAGLAINAFGAFMHKLGRVAVYPEVPRSFSETNLDRDISATIEDSRVSSLLVGWGIGYWVTSLLYVLGGSWYEGGWNNAPIAIRVLAYVVIPCFSLVSLFTVADANVLGARFGALVKPAVKILQNRRTVWYWVLATVYRDVFLLWTMMWFVLMHSMNNL